MDLSVNISGSSSGSVSENGKFGFVLGQISVNLTSEAVTVNRSTKIDANRNGRSNSADVVTKNLSLDASGLPWSSLRPVSMQISGSATAVARHDFGGFALGLAQYGNTIVWGGITNLYDEDMNPIDLSQYEVSALSPDGFDYANAAVVPLPAAGWLLLSSLGLLRCLGFIAFRKS